MKAVNEFSFSIFRVRWTARKGTRETSPDGSEAGEGVSVSDTKVSKTESCGVSPITDSQVNCCKSEKHEEWSYVKKKTTKSHAGGSHSPHEVCCQIELLLLWAFYQVYSHQVTSTFLNFRTIGWVKNNIPSALYTHTYCEKKKKRKVIALSTMGEKRKERECIWSSGAVSLGTNLCVTPGCSFCLVILLQAVGYWLLHYKEQLEECWLAQGSKSSWFLLCAWIYGCK